MAGVYPKNQHGPLSYSASEPVEGGQLVSVSGQGTVRPARSGDTAILGVANTDARPYSEAEHYPTTAYGAPTMDASVPGALVSVGHIGVYELAASGAVDFGALVQPANSGQVGAHSGGTVVGRCVAPAGIASGERGAVLLMLLGTAVPTASEPDSGTGDQ